MFAFKRVVSTFILSACLVATNNTAFSASIDKERSGKRKDSEVKVELCDMPSSENKFVAGAAIATAAATIIINESIEGFLNFNRNKLKKQTFPYGSLLNFPEINKDSCIKITRTLQNAKTASEFKFQINEFTSSSSDSNNNAAFTITPISAKISYAGAETEVNKGIDVDVTISITQLNNNNQIAQLINQTFEFKKLEFEKEYYPEPDKKKKKEKTLKVTPSISAVFPAITKNPGTITVAVMETGSKIRKLENRIEFLERNRETVQNLLQTLAGNIIPGASN